MKTLYQVLKEFSDKDYPNQFDKIKMIHSVKNVPEVYRRSATYFTWDFFKEFAHMNGLEFTHEDKMAIECYLEKYDSHFSMYTLLNILELTSLEKQYNAIHGDKIKQYPETLRELLAFPVERSTKSMYELVDHSTNFFPRVSESFNFDYDRATEESGIEIHYIKDFCFDGRRVYILAYVTLDGEPKALFYRGGRDGCDRCGIYSIGENGTNDLSTRLETFVEKEDWEKDTVINLDDYIDKSFTNIYDNYDIMSEFKPWNT